MDKGDLEIARQVLRVRLGQMFVNEAYKLGRFRIPIHLALGHEAIAVAVDAVMGKEDKLILSHRNIHYNLARIRVFKPLLDEYLLDEKGLSRGKLGSMNLANEERNILYTSNVLGNNLGVASGVALGHAVKRQRAVVFVVTGDGAIEEGSFYEALQFLRSHRLPSVVLVENNGWSMFTRIHERRCGIDLGMFAGSMRIPYERLSGNDPYVYADRIREIKKSALKDQTPFCVEVELKTLGSWVLQTDGHPERFINYHAGPAPAVQLTEWPMLEASSQDPVFVLTRYADEGVLRGISKELLKKIEEECCDVR